MERVSNACEALVILLSRVVQSARLRGRNLKEDNELLRVRLCCIDERRTHPVRQQPRRVRHRLRWRAYREVLYLPPPWARRSIGRTQREHRC